MIRQIFLVFKTERFELGKGTFINFELCVCLGVHNPDKVVKVQEPLPNHLIKQQQEVDS